MGGANPALLEAFKQSINLASPCRRAGDMGTVIKFMGVANLSPEEKKLFIEHILDQPIEGIIQDITTLLEIIDHQDHKRGEVEKAFRVAEMDGAFHPLTDLLNKVYSI